MPVDVNKASSEGKRSENSEGGLFSAFTVKNQVALVATPPIPSLAITYHS